jgi:hypothetical protein
MAESYKILGQVALTDAKEKILYVSPAGKQAIVTNITAVNTGAGANTALSVNVYNSAKTAGDLADVVATSIFVAPQEGGSQCFYSTDGITWAPSSNFGYGYWTGNVAVGPYGFVPSPSTYVNQYSPMLSSTDGITWTTLNVPSMQQYTNIKQCAYGNNIYALVSAYPYQTFYSTDLVTWTISEVSWPGYADIINLRYVLDKWIALTTGPDVWRSTDLVTWDVHSGTLPTGNTPSGLAASATTAVITCGKYSQGSDAMYSTDGATWSLSTMPAGSPWNSVVYGAGKFVSVGSSPYGAGPNTYAAYSTNGITWTMGTLPQSAVWTRIGYNGEKFSVLSSYDNKVAYSTNGVTWSSGTLTTGTFSMANSIGADSVVGSFTSPAVNRVYNNVTLPNNTSKVLEPGIVLGPQNSIVVKGANNTTVSVYGVELS